MGTEGGWEKRFRKQRVFTYRSPNGNIDQLSLGTLDKLGALVVEELPQD